eukprot:2460887-Heterocapsa_arctica.AAC.1
MPKAYSTQPKANGTMLSYGMSLLHNALPTRAGRSRYRGARTFTSLVVCCRTPLYVYFAAAL